jgi:hypothetical protein
MGKLLEAFFAGLIKTGSIEIETAGRPKFTLGDGSGTKLGLPRMYGGRTVALGSCLNKVTFSIFRSALENPCAYCNGVHHGMCDGHGGCI